MPRYYVRDKGGRWNVFSTIVDDFLYEEFVPFEILKQRVVLEYGKWKEKELQTLLTEKPELNVMNYEEAIETRYIVHGGKEPCA